MSTRTARPTDAPAVVGLIRASFSPEFIDRTIYGCDGIERFLAAQLSLDCDLQPSVHLVAVSRGVLAGYCELASTDSGAVLNYIAVSHSERGQSVGTQLFIDALNRISLPGSATIELDVLVDNPARRWYEAVGFVVRERQRWWEVEDWVCVSKTEGAILDYPQETVCHREYGFSQIRIRGDAGVRVIGQLGKRWFRLADSRLLGDLRVIGALRRLDPSRHLLVLAAPISEPVPPYATSNVELVRMEGRAGVVKHRLEKSVTDGGQHDED